MRQGQIKFSVVVREIKPMPFLFQIIVIQLRVTKKSNSFELKMITFNNCFKSGGNNWKDNIILWFCR